MNSTHTEIPTLRKDHAADLDIGYRLDFSIDGWNRRREEILSLVRSLVSGERDTYDTRTEVKVSRMDADFVNGFAREAAAHALKVGRRREAERFRTIETLSARWLSPSTPASRTDGGKE
jgi:hypothetical protein